MLKIVFTLLEEQATSRGGQMYLAFPFQLVFPDPTLRQYYNFFRLNSKELEERKISDNISIKISIVKLNINDVCNLITLVI
jgi:hypothetical protein